MGYDAARYGCRYCGQHYTTRAKRDAHERTHEDGGAAEVIQGP